jgi:hypothetical protein
MYGKLLKWFRAVPVSADITFAAYLPHRSQRIFFEFCRQDSEYLNVGYGELLLNLLLVKVGHWACCGGVVLIAGSVGWLDFHPTPALVAHAADFWPEAGGQDVIYHYIPIVA